MLAIVRRILIFLHLNLIGTWKSCQEQIWDRHKRLPRDLPKKTGKNLVITGGGRGIGFEATKKLLEAGFHVIMGVRNPEKVQEKMQTLEGSYEVLQLDLNSLESVKTFSKEVFKKNIPIHVLINNAGIMFGPRKESQDGHEQQLATNHLGHFLLTHLLLPKLIEGGTKDCFARVINVSSVAHFCGSWVDWNDINCKNFYHPYGAYGTSKAAQVLTSIYLNEKCQTMDEIHVTFNSVHPGVVRTELYTNAKLLYWIGALFMKSPEQGGDTLVHAALSPELEGKGGLYLENSQEATPSSFSRNIENQIKMWNASCQACGISEFFQQ